MATEEIDERIHDTSSPSFDDEIERTKSPQTTFSIDSILQSQSSLDADQEDSNAYSKEEEALLEDNLKTSQYPMSSSYLQKDHKEDIKTRKSPLEMLLNKKKLDNLRPNEIDYDEIDNKISTTERTKINNNIDGYPTPVVSSRSISHSDWMLSCSCPTCLNQKVKGYIANHHYTESPPHLYGRVFDAQVYHRHQLRPYLEGKMYFIKRHKSAAKCWGTKQNAWEHVCKGCSSYRPIPCEGNWVDDSDLPTSRKVATYQPLSKHDQQNNNSKRRRTIFTTNQLERLEYEFQQQQYIVGQERRYLARELGLNEVQVKVWFQNRRIKWRKYVGIIHINEM